MAMIEMELGIKPGLEVYDFMIYQSLVSIPSIPFYLSFKVSAHVLKKSINSLNIRKEMLHFTNLSFIKNQIVFEGVGYLSKW